VEAYIIVKGEAGHLVFFFFHNKKEKKKQEKTYKIS
jgi:hypothetical protein